MIMSGRCSISLQYAAALRRTLVTYSPSSSAPSASASIWRNASSETSFTLTTGVHAREYSSAPSRPPLAFPLVHARHSRFRWFTPATGVSDCGPTAPCTCGARTGVAPRIPPGPLWGKSGHLDRAVHRKADPVELLLPPFPLTLVTLCKLRQYRAAEQLHGFQDVFVLSRSALHEKQHRVHVRILIRAQVLANVLRRSDEQTATPGSVQRPCAFVGGFQ